ncbi:MAG TPA: thioredoxin family protein [Kofleriaceae bacterium]|nr:thioredoxin family protein [Kofleriaceae bacterium]
MKRWLLALAACGASTPPPTPVDKTVQLNTDGALVHVEDSLVDGYVTIVDFWSTSCEACTIVTGMIAVQIAKQPQVIVRKVDVGDGFTAVAKAYDIGTLPHVNVYDRKRRLRYRLIGPEALRAPTLARELLAEP